MSLRFKDLASESRAWQGKFVFKPIFQRASRGPPHFASRPTNRTIIKSGPLHKLKLSRTNARNARFPPGRRRGGRFLESLLLFLRMDWDHNPSLTPLRSVTDTRGRGWVGSRRAPLRWGACIGTMNLGTSRAGRKAPINRTHSRRFARFGDARQSRSVWSACVFSAAFPSQATIR